MRYVLQTIQVLVNGWVTNPHKLRGISTEYIMKSHRMHAYRECKGGANAGVDEGYRAGTSSCLRADCTTAPTAVSI
jgi:hypothetical protein